MWFRSLDGNLKEINRKDFVSCKDYYNSVSKIIMTINVTNILNIFINSILR